MCFPALAPLHLPWLAAPPPASFSAHTRLAFRTSGGSAPPPRSSCLSPEEPGHSLACPHGRSRLTCSVLLGTDSRLEGSGEANLSSADCPGCPAGACFPRGVLKAACPPLLQAFSGALLSKCVCRVPRGAWSRQGLQTYLTLDNSLATVIWASVCSLWTMFVCGQ